MARIPIDSVAQFLQAGKGNGTVGFTFNNSPVTRCNFYNCLPPQFRSQEQPDQQVEEPQQQDAQEQQHNVQPQAQQPEAEAPAQQQEAPEEQPEAQQEQNHLVAAVPAGSSGMSRRIGKTDGNGNSITASQEHSPNSDVRVAVTALKTSSSVSVNPADAIYGMESSLPTAPSYIEQSDISLPAVNRHGLDSSFEGRANYGMESSLVTAPSYIEQSDISLPAVNRHGLDSCFEGGRPDTVQPEIGSPEKKRPRLYAQKTGILFPVPATVRGNPTTEDNPVKEEDD